MITMQELTQHFKPILARTIDTKEPTDNGIKIPYKNIAKVCIEFAPGKNYRIGIRNRKKGENNDGI